MLAEPHFAKNALALHSLLEDAQSLLNVIITNIYLQFNTPYFTGHYRTWIGPYCKKKRFQPFV